MRAGVGARCVRECELKGNLANSFTKLKKHFKNLCHGTHGLD